MEGFLLTGAPDSGQVRSVFFSLSPCGNFANAADIMRWILISSVGRVMMDRYCFSVLYSETDHLATSCSLFLSFLYRGSPWPHPGDQRRPGRGPG